MFISDINFVRSKLHFVQNLGGKTALESNFCGLQLRPGTEKYFEAELLMEGIIQKDACVCCQMFSLSVTHTSILWVTLSV